MWMHKTCGWQRGETDRETLWTLSASLSRWALQHTVLRNSLFRQSPAIFNRQKVGRQPCPHTPPPHDRPVDVLLRLLMTVCFLRAQKQARDGFEISTLGACWLPSRASVITVLLLGTEIQGESSPHKPLGGGGGFWAQGWAFMFPPPVPISLLLPLFSPSSQENNLQVWAGPVSSRLTLVECQSEGDYRDRGRGKEISHGGLFRQGAPSLRCPVRDILLKTTGKHFHFTRGRHTFSW